MAVVHESLPARRPARKLLVDEVRDLIAEEFIFSGVVAPGDVLPSEMELASRYGVSRATVRSSLSSLRHARLVAVRNGVGSVVLARPRTLMDGMEQLSSVETFARRGGQAVEASDVRWDERGADEDAAEKLGVALGDRLIVVEHTKSIGGTPIAWAVDHIPAEVLPREMLEAQFDGSTLDVLTAAELVAVDSADSEFTAVGLSRNIARRLNVRAGTPALYLDQAIRSEDGRIVQWAQTWLLPEHFQLTLHRRRAATP